MANIYRSSSTNLVRAGSLARDTGFGGYVAFGGPTLSVADLGSLTRLEVSRCTLITTYIRVFVTRPIHQLIDCRILCLG